MSWDWHEKNHYTLHQWRSGPSHWSSSEIYLLCSSRGQQHLRVVFPWHLAPWHQSPDSQFKFTLLKLSRECLIRHQIRVWNGVTTKCFLQFGNSKPSLKMLTKTLKSFLVMWKILFDLTRIELKSCSRYTPSLCYSKPEARTSNFADVKNGNLWNDFSVLQVSCRHS